MLLDANLRAHDGVAAVGADDDTRIELALDAVVPESHFGRASRDYLQIGDAAQQFGARFDRFAVEQVAHIRMPHAQRRLEAGVCEHSHIE